MVKEYTLFGVRDVELKLTKVEGKPPHRLQWRGKHNKLKALAWLALLNVAGDSGLPIRELARYAGTTQHSMRTSLSNWRRWKYVGSSHSRAETLYQLTWRGHEWLNIQFWRAPFGKWYEMMSREQREFYKHNLAQWNYMQEFHKK